MSNAYSKTMEPIVVQAVLRMLIDRMAAHSENPAEEREAMRREVHEWIDSITGRDNMVRAGLNDAGLAIVEDIFAESFTDPPPSGDD